MTKDSEPSLKKCIAGYIFGSDVRADSSSKTDDSGCDVLTDYDVSASFRLAASLRDGTPLVLEGSVASVVADLPLAENIPSTLWALDEPETVYAAHRLYGATGIDVALASLAGCLPQEIEQLGLNVSMETLVGAQIRAATQCGCPYVMAEIDGAAKPSGAPSPRTPASLPGAAVSLYDVTSYRALILAALDCGVHGFILGSMLSLHDLRTVYQTIRSVSDAPVIGLCSLKEHALETPHGDLIEDVMAAFEEIAKTDAIAIGFDEVSPHNLCQIADDIADYARAYNVRPAVRIRSPFCAGGCAGVTVDPAMLSVVHAVRVSLRSGITILGAASGVPPATVADLVAVLHP